MAGLTTIRVQRSFLAKPEKIYDAWLDPAIARKFLFATPDGEMQRVDIDAKEGGGFVIIERRGAQDVEHHGTYEKLARPQRIVFTFTASPSPDVATRVSIDIMPDGNGSAVTVTHEGVPAGYAQKTEEGWTKILNGLAAAVPG
ncbi:MAG TPA: SRPBCC family protein [Patescibacteria group bacterium]|nr:SRPBCC family protein [Patescibacteria group bacterium]